jgi:hypothetical protein
MTDSNTGRCKQCTVHIAYIDIRTKPSSLREQFCNNQVNFFHANVRLYLKLCARSPVEPSWSAPAPLFPPQPSGNDLRDELRKQSAQTAKTDKKVELQSRAAKRLKTPEEVRGQDYYRLAGYDCSAWETPVPPPPQKKKKFYQCIPSLCIPLQMALANLSHTLVNTASAMTKLVEEQKKVRLGYHCNFLPNNDVEKPLVRRDSGVQSHLDVARTVVQYYEKHNLLESRIERRHDTSLYHNHNLPSGRPMIPWGSVYAPTPPRPYSIMSVRRCGCALCPASSARLQSNTASTVSDRLLCRTM